MRGRQSSRKVGPLGPTISLQLRFDDDAFGDDYDEEEDNAVVDDDNGDDRACGAVS